MRKLLSLLFVCSLVLTAVMFSAQPAAAQDGILPVIENCQISGHAPIGFEVGWDTPFGTISVRGEGFLTPVTLKLPAGVYNNTAIKLWVRDPDGILTLAPFDLTYTGVCPGNILGYYEAQDGRLNKYDPTASFMYYCRTDGIEVWHYAAGEAGFPVFTISYADIYATLTAAAASGQSMFVPGSG
ncbi:MAG: hypothetical protein JW966_12925, partial [Anaerolineae bacterium]|nr:hypothetical protein [Anaerolineae bacterium]